MSDAKHRPDEDRSFQSSVIRHAGGAAALVVLVAAVFWVIGSFGGPDDPVPTAADTTDPGDADPGDDGDRADGEVAGDDAEPDDPPADDGAEADEVSTDPSGADDTDGSDDGTEEADADEADGDDADEDEEQAPPPPSIDPATISVQVLDGYQVDGGAAASAVADQLDTAGYNIVARNPALRYEVTTVLWTAGFQAEGEQVAAAIGAAEVRQQPGNLSTQVAVHVVVGADRG